MKRNYRLLIVSIVFIAKVIWIFQGVGLVPFHPDESSVLYQSRDFEVWFTEPLSLVWDASNSDDYDQQYRALNAPLAKYVLGIGRRLAGYGPEAVDARLFDLLRRHPGADGFRMGVMLEDAGIVGRDEVHAVVQAGHVLEVGQAIVVPRVH